jgi:hypothetical protein
MRDIFSGIFLPTHYIGAAILDFTFPRFLFTLAYFFCSFADFIAHILLASIVRQLEPLIG